MANKRDTARTNGADKPLVVASRTREYRNAVRGNSGRPVERAAELKLCDLAVTDIKDFLAPVAGDSWTRVFERLDSEVDGPLVNALGNPLILALTKDVYADRSPDELADRYRFGSRPAIEGHLLGRFVRAAYAENRHRISAGRFRCTAEDAQRWLGFLAGEFNRSYVGWRDRTRQGIHAVDLAWWHLGHAVRDWRALGVVLRCLLRSGVIAAVVIWLKGSKWRHGSEAGRSELNRLLLAGPLGRLARPAMNQLLPPIGNVAVTAARVLAGFVFRNGIRALFVFTRISRTCESKSN